MARQIFSCHLPVFLLVLLDALSFVVGNVDAVNVDQTNPTDFYIVYLGDRPDNKDEAIQKHTDLLSSLKLSEDEAKESLVYSYTQSFNAFAAKLSPNEAKKLMDIEEVLGVFRNRYHKLHTTRSWDFIGLPLTAKRNLKVERDIILGVLDTGTTPDSESFRDDGLGPPPAKWKGSCGHFANFSGCNNKLIGAKYFKLDGVPDAGDILSPIDVDGHGTHTSSTAAGALVVNASLDGLANGTARGAVPSARVAVYKVCWTRAGCADMDILAAFDAAIHDGVDVVSISIGGPLNDYTADSISVGSFHALRKGILTVASAGNEGPSLGSVLNHIPWVLTVAASGIDRAFKSRVDLGNGKSVSGTGISLFKPKMNSYPLVSGVDVAKGSDKEGARFCFPGSLDAKKAKGRIILCKFGGPDPDSTVKGVRGTGTIVESESFLDSADIFMVPATMVNSTIGDMIDHYIHSTSSPTAVIQRSMEMKIQAPFIASFSSRGPNPISKRLLKPDIAAPGVDILAAYTLMKSLTGGEGDTQFSKFTLMSGTSMSCPHVAGVAAYVKSFHPKWTAAAIKSAIITSAKPMSRRVNNEGEFAYGAGQVDPRRAVYPGLVYDMDELSYIQFLCAEGYNGSSLAKLVNSKSINCTSLLPGLGYDSLNYPTMQLTTKNPKETTVGVFRRRVTNVGPALSFYNATIRAPKGVEITVKPTSLTFSRALQKRSFKVVVKAKPLARGKILSGLLVWKNPRHVVRSPIVIYSPTN